MMKMNSMRKLLSVILCMVLIAAMALLTTGCGSKEEPPVTQEATEGKTPETTAAAEEASGSMVNFELVVTGVDGQQTTVNIVTDQTTVGAALIEAGIIEGEEGPYGLYIKSVNGTTLDYEKDGKYWAFYENGEYALTGVDMTEITPGATYELKAE